MNLKTRLVRFSQKHQLFSPGDVLVVGVSGGVDSLSLLHLLCQLRSELRLGLHVAHFNHNLRPTAEADALHLIDLCWVWKVPIHVEKGLVAKQAQASGRNLEAVAREMRYQFLCEVAQKVGARNIAVAHHATDQAETVLMNLLRGSGLRGLRGMLPATPLTDYVADEPPLLIRPLLNITRPELEAYCTEHQLQPRHDESNNDPDRTRNHLRHELLPRLHRYNPNIVETLGRTSQLIAAEYETLSRDTRQGWQACLHKQSDERIVLSQRAFGELSLATQRRVLRHALSELPNALDNISFDHIEAMIDLAAKGQPGGQLDLPGQVQMQLTAEQLILQTITAPRSPIAEPHLNLAHLPAGYVMVQVPGETPLPGTAWILQTTIHTVDSFSEAEIRSPQPWQAFLDAEVVGSQPILRGRQPGDYFYPLGLGGHRQKVKDFMINAKIPAEKRASLPLLSAKTGQIHWVSGWRIDQRARVTAHTQRILKLSFERAG